MRQDLGIPFCVLLAQNKLAWTQKEAYQRHQPWSVCGLRLISLSSSLVKHKTLLRAWHLAEKSLI